MLCLSGDFARGVVVPGAACAPAAAARDGAAGVRALAGGGVRLARWECGFRAERRFWGRKVVLPIAETRLLSAEINCSIVENCVQNNRTFFLCFMMLKLKVKTRCC